MFFDYPAIKAALMGGEITLHYQPIHCLKSGELRGYEALARWGKMPPPRIAAIIQAHSLQALWIEQQVAQVNQVLAQLPEHLWVSINIDQSAIALRNLPEILGNTPNPSRLVVEVLEAVKIDDRVAAMLQALGCIHILRADDIGAVDYGWIDRIVGEYADLFDGLKLCKGLTYRVCDDMRTATFCAMMLTAANTMGLSTVAEWVTTREQAQWLHEHGCDCGQGELFGMPGPLG